MEIFNSFKKTFKTLSALMLVALFVAAVPMQAENYKYSDSWGNNGFNLVEQAPSGLKMIFSVTEFNIEQKNIDGEPMQTLHFQGVYLPNQSGSPDLPGMSRYIALPEGATPQVKIISRRTETFQNMEIAPAFEIPLITDDRPLTYKKNMEVYGKNEFYPASPVIVSDVQQMRGVDVSLINVTPFQYNPVTKELVVYRDLEIEVSFVGGSAQFGENRWRSIWWDQILKNNIVNSNMLPKIDYTTGGSREVATDYVIITPPDADFVQWANVIKDFRNEQGIKTMVVTTTEIGGNSADAIEDYFDDMATWDPVPSAVLLLGDYGSSNTTITSPTRSHPYSGSCISDNIYADVTGDHLPDFATARMTARNSAELELMIGKFMNYEMTPPENQYYYDHPVTAMGWQTDRWFQICSEIVNGFWEYGLGKEPVRENAIGSGSPSGSWSSNENTGMIVDYFGPNGLGYIPATPNHLNDWGGNATRLNNDINQGAFMIQHRDHGGETGWSEPDYGNSDINGLNGNDLVYVFSINCLTGKFDYSSECFAEKFHRYDNGGALGIMAATEVSYSFVNDTYVWGMYDGMWPDFMPAEGEPGPVRLLPAFGNVNGKFFLSESSWPYNPSEKEITYELFHHHGDAFSVVYSEMPQALPITHDAAIISGNSTFSVITEEDVLIGLSVDGELIASGYSDGSVLNIPLPFIQPGKVLKVVATKQNYYRYESDVNVVPADGPYVVKEHYVINDASGNNNGMMDYAENNLLTLYVQNVGQDNAENVTVTISSTDEYVTITDATELYGLVPADDTTFVTDGFAFDVAENIPDGHNVTFTCSATDGDSTWISYFSIEGHAPVVEYAGFEVNDAAGNGNGRVDPGETVDLIVGVRNDGTSAAYNLEGMLQSSDSYITINSNSATYGELAAGAEMTKTFNITANANTPMGHIANFMVEFTADHDIYTQGDFFTVVGQFPVLIVDLDENNNSANHLHDAFLANGIVAEYSTSIPSDLTLYTSIFVCLGIYDDNHELTSAEGQALADFLDNGGSVYMEGGDTWYYDDPTPVHSYFNIGATSDGDDDLGTLIGQNGTFAEGMQFGYSGDNNWIDRLTASAPAEIVFQNNNPVYGAMIAHDADTYKTIGASFEFGGLTDGSAPSTKEKLMAEIIDFFELNGSGSNDTTIYRDVSVNEGWNLISVPVEADEMATTTLFPNAISSAFKFNQQYQLVDELEMCEGYWLKFPAAEITELGGLMQMMPIEVNEGWNMIGIFYEDEPTTFINSVPAGIISSQFFEFNAGYVAANTLEVGKGYWVKTTQTGELYIDSSLAKKNPVANVINSEGEWGTIVIEDAAGNRMTLYSPAELDNAEDYELPPAPPAGVFDVRFESGNFVEMIPDMGSEVILNSVTYPVKISATGADLRITDCVNGEIVNEIVRDGAEVVITDSRIKKINVTTAEIPDSYALSQNYPNPFNPSTTIQVALPENVKVSLKVYDMLGQEVETLINKDMDAGYHVIKWNAAKYASGVYFYRITAGDFVSTKKLMLLK